LDARDPFDLTQQDFASNVASPLDSFRLVAGNALTRVLAYKQTDLT